MRRVGWSWVRSVSFDMGRSVDWISERCTGASTSTQRQSRGGLRVAPFISGHYSSKTFGGRLQNTNIDGHSKFFQMPWRYRLYDTTTSPYSQRLPATCSARFQY